MAFATFIDKKERHPTCFDPTCQSGKTHNPFQVNLTLPTLMLHPAAWLVPRSDWPSLDLLSVLLGGSMALIGSVFHPRAQGTRR